MDFDPEKIHDDLLQVALPSTVSDLKNPTEEYVINLLTQFLNKFLIDLSTIKKPTTEQQSLLSLARDNAEIISYINLSEAMAGICSKIFLKDFYLTDLTSPSPRRTRKLAKVLSNFVLYALNKSNAIDERQEEIKCKYQELEYQREQKNSLLERKNQKALDMAKNVVLKEQLEAEIARVRLLKDARQAKIVEVQARLKAMEKEKLEIVQHHGNLTAEAIKMRKAIEELELKLVRSPERHQARLQEMIKQKKSQMEKREVIQEAIRSKKPAIERLESHLSFVRNEHATFPEVTSACKRLTEKKRVMLETQKKVSEMKSIIEKETAMAKEENGGTNNASLKKTRDQCEQHLSTIRNELADLLNEKNSMVLKLEDALTHQQEIYTERDKTRTLIQQAENEYKNFVVKCQSFYDKEIDQERKMKEDFDKLNC